MPSTTWHHQNIPSTTTLPKDPTKDSFTLTTPSHKTDIWRPASTPADDVFNAPLLYTKTSLSAFETLRATFSAPWKTQFDQGGLCLAVPDLSFSGTESDERKVIKWIKSGIEFYEGTPAVSTVACDRFSDWTLTPLLSGSTVDGQPGCTVEIVNDVQGGKFVVNAVLGGGERQVLREVPWGMLGLEGSDAEGREVWVGLYVAKPTKAEEEELEVNFRDVQVEC